MFLIIFTNVYQIFYIIFYFILLYFIIFYYILLYFIIFYYILLYFIIFYYHNTSNLIKIFIVS